MINNIDGYIKVIRRLSQDGEFKWWQSLDKFLMDYKKAIQFLHEIPDDMDYPTDEEFRKALNKWYRHQVIPFLKEIE